MTGSNHPPLFDGMASHAARAYPGDSGCTVGCGRQSWMEAVRLLARRYFDYDIDAGFLKVAPEAAQSSGFDIPDTAGTRGETEHGRIVSSHELTAIRIVRSTVSLPSDVQTEIPGLVGRDTRIRCPAW